MVPHRCNPSHLTYYEYTATERNSGEGKGHHRTCRTRPYLLSKFLGIVWSDEGCSIPDIVKKQWLTLLKLSPTTTAQHFKAFWALKVTPSSCTDFTYTHLNCWLQISPLEWACCCCSDTRSCLCNPMDRTCPVPLSSTISGNLLKLMSIESMMLSNHLAI